MDTNKVVFIAIFIGIISMFSFILGQNNGIQTVANSCVKTGAYKINENEILLCVIKPNIPYKEVDLYYLRPKGKETI